MRGFVERTIGIGTRRSPLALKQVDEILNLLARKGICFPYIIRGIDTVGDRDKTTPISEIEGSDFFTRELDRALCLGEIDCVVHSAKDLPDIVPAGLAVAAVTASIDPSDAFVARNKIRLEEIAAGARIGVSSRRRKEQMAIFRPDVKSVDIRGTIGERLGQLFEGKYDALIVASAALIRLGLGDLIGDRLDPEFFKPHPFQGRLAVVVRWADEELKQLFSKIHGEFCP